MQVAQYVRWVGSRVIDRSAAGGLALGGVVSMVSCKRMREKKGGREGTTEEVGGWKISGSWGFFWYTVYM